MNPGFQRYGVRHATAAASTVVGATLTPPKARRPVLGDSRLFG